MCREWARRNSRKHLYTVRQLPTVTDSTKVEVRVVEKIVKDTAWFEFPVIVEKVATLDTASVLENKCAKSETSVSGGY